MWKELVLMRQFPSQFQTHLANFSYLEVFHDVLLGYLVQVKQIQKETLECYF